ncbi:MAG: ATP-binding protein [Clostridia bacterium]|nr:ATP-binding protein [Clostridia bacterium]
MAASKNGGKFSTDSEFVNVVSNCYYVDKSLLIRDLIDDCHNFRAMLFTRPRRFGKSLNLSMIQTFFEKTDKDTSFYFKNLNIWKCGDRYTSEQGKYPVIYFDFKDVKCSTCELALRKIKSRLGTEFSRHKELKNSTLVDADNDLPKYFRIVGGTANAEDVEDSLLTLSRMLYAHHGVKPIILIDEYDVPIRYGYEHGYYSEITEFFGNLLSAAIKGNNNLNFAVITGAMCIAKEGIFTGLNNLVVYSVLTDEYSQYFGFTKDEVKQILDDFGHPEKMDEICEWYDGYLFGDTEIFNPWSVSNYVNFNFNPKAYWVKTSGNTIISDLMRNPSDLDRKRLNELLGDVPVKLTIKEEVTYEELYRTKNESKGGIYSVMLAAGYLTPESHESGSYVIPNKEIREIYTDEILSRLWGKDGPDTADKIKDALKTGNAGMLEDALSCYFMSSVSYHDLTEERDYHNFMDGFGVALTGDFRVRSNEESGKGRFDISYEPRDLLGTLPGVILEFKVCKKKSRMEKEIKTAFSQIESMKYEAKLKDAGVKRIDRYAIVFCGKDVMVEKK